MQSTRFPKKVPLTGADKFILALESSGRAKMAKENVCIYRLSFDRNFELDALKEKLFADEQLAYLSSLRLSGKGDNYNFWKTSEQGQIDLTVTNSPEEFFEKPFDLFKKAPLRVVITKKSEAVEFYLIWHHLLMDGQGATLLLRHLNGEKIELALPRTGSRLNWKNFSLARQAKKYIDRSASGKIQSVESKIHKDRTSVIFQYTVPAAQAEVLRQKARENQSKFGLGNYLLVLCARAVHRTFHHEKPLTYWIPIPQDTRKKNAVGPILGNQLSFLFYRLEMQSEMSEQELVAQLDSQMMTQIREKIPQKNGHLLNFMRRFNPRWYYRLLTGPSGTMLTSFLYTYAPDHPQSLMEFQGQKVQSALNLPPNSYPPGLTFSIQGINGEITISVQSFDHLLTAEREVEFSRQISTLILQAE